MFMLLHALLDLQPDLTSGSIRVDPVLPPLFRRISLDNLRVGNRRVNLRIEREHDDIGVELTGAMRLTRPKP